MAATLHIETFDNCRTSSLYICENRCHTWKVIDMNLWRSFRCSTVIGCRLGCAILIAVMMETARISETSVNFYLHIDPSPPHVACDNPRLFPKIHIYTVWTQIHFIIILHLRLYLLSCLFVEVVSTKILAAFVMSLMTAMYPRLTLIFSEVFKWRVILCSGINIFHSFSLKLPLIHKILTSSLFTCTKFVSVCLATGYGQCCGKIQQKFIFPARYSS